MQDLLLPLVAVLLSSKFLQQVKRRYVFFGDVSLKAALKFYLQALHTARRPERASDKTKRIKIPAR
jgi:hypothetical protein